MNDGHVEEASNDIFGFDPDILYGIFVFLVFTLFGIFGFFQNQNINSLIEINRKALERKEVIEAGEKSYLQSSIQIKELVLLAKHGISFAAKYDLPIIDPLVEDYKKYLDEVTDDKPIE